jgi:hypothetical protein
MKKILLFLVLLPLFLFVVSPSHADYSPNFTATNVVFNLSTYHLEFDYSGAPFTDNQIFSFDLRNVNADTTGLWWRSTSGTTITCSNNHCSGNLTGLVNPSYPSPYPTGSQQMVLQVYIDSTGTEYFSQSFTYSSTGGYVCLTGSPQSGYSPTFTASNIVFTPATKKLSFDYSGASFTDSQIQSFDLRNIDAATTGLWWRSTGGTSITCSNNHCEGFLTGAVNGSYPTLWPTDPQTMVVDVYTGSEHFSQGFAFGSIWQGGACFVPPNQPPQVNAFQSATINEGATYSASGSFTDTDSASWSATVNYGDGTGAQPLSLNPDKTFSLSHLYKDNGTYTVTVTVTDNQGASDTETATVTVNNVAPTVGNITVTPSPAHINEAVSASASFTDPGVLDTHTATLNWGDGSPEETGTVTESNGSGSVTDSHTYTNFGTYTITLTVKDKDNATGNNTTTITVVKQITVLNPAEVWLSKGLLNIGLRFDVLAEAFKDSTLVSSGQLNSVQVGSGGFNNADLISIPFNSFSPVDFPQDSQLKLKLSVRNACSGSLPNQGTARLWFNDNQANSHFGATIGTTNNSYYLLDNFLLSTTVGAGPRQNIDVQAGAKCSPFKPFGTWTITP